MNWSNFDLVPKWRPFSVRTRQNASWSLAGVAILFFQILMAFAQPSDLEQRATAVESGDQEAIFSEIDRFAQGKVQDSPLMSVDQPFLVLWLYPILLETELGGDGRSFSASEIERLAKLLLTTVAQCEAFSKEVRAWCDKRLKTESVYYPSARRLLLHNLLSLQQPGSIDLAAPDLE